jgi:hypothetical protein
MLAFPTERTTAMNPLRHTAAALAGATALVVTGLAGAAHAGPTASEQGGSCIRQGSVSAGARGAAGFRSRDHREVTALQQRRIEARTSRILAADGTSRRSASTDFQAEIPVYVHVMLDKSGNGDVTDEQIDDQISVLNDTYGGDESSDAANTGFTFTLAGVDRINNDAWHLDKQTNKYRSQTREGGKDALNIWLVDFPYLGIATFPWDYAGHSRIDGVRVNYGSLPDGPIENFNLGETATHEVGHWLGLFHTFQGGCTPPGDDVADTPAEAGPASGCPEGQDTCSADGEDPVHNYMDYSYDSCYDQFTPDQAARMAAMWTAYRALPAP